jgi:hypothetical protein
MLMVGIQTAARAMECVGCIEPVPLLLYPVGDAAAARPKPTSAFLVQQRSIKASIGDVKSVPQQLKPSLGGL